MARLFLIFFMLLASIHCSANPIINLNQQQENQAKVSPEQHYQTKLRQIKHTTKEQQLTEKNYAVIEREYELKRQKFNEQLKQAQRPLKIQKHTELQQQASLAYVHLSELKESEATLGHQIAAELQRQKQLPKLISAANESLNQHKKIPLKPNHTPDGQVQLAQRQLYQQNLKTLQTEFTTNPTRIELLQQQLELVRHQLSQQEKLIELLNREISKQRQQVTSDTLSKNLINDQQVSDPITQQISDSNKSYGQQLQQITTDINHILDKQEQAEVQYQQQSAQLSNIQEQITWVKLNSTFGERFLQILQSLPKPPSTDKVQGIIANTRLARYHIEQQLSINQQQMTDESFSQLQTKLMSSQQVLLGKLIEAYDIYLTELAKLKLSYEQLNIQYVSIKKTLTEHLFWVPNASPISKLWLTDLHHSFTWLINQAPWQQLPQSLTKQANLWFWWVIILVVCLAAQDLITPKFQRIISHYGSFVGKVTQDNFIYTIKTLFISGAYSLLWPAPIILAGAILFSSSTNFIQAIGMAVIAMGALQFFYRFYSLLALPNGLLTLHFGRQFEVVNDVKIRLREFIIIATPLIGIVGFSEVLDSSLFRNSIGRSAFIILCLQLTLLYKDALSISRRFRDNPNNDGKNKKLLHKLLWLILFTVPLLDAALATLGYYFTAYQLLLQLQLSILLGLGFLLIYQLIRRWMLIQRRKIAFDRAKARRAERLAQRVKGELQTADNNETFEEPVVDLETIASQSLGLVRSLLLLAFLASLIGLWSQTHTALFSFLDSITLWTSSTSINGLEQTIPITLKSLLFGLIIFGFALMITTNLPGLMELMILQKLDLSPGTGFAITTVSRYIVVLVGSLVGFSTLGMEWSKLQWLIAALSVGLGFGLQEIFANFISGLIILFEKPIRIGDTVTIRELTGTVSKIKIRATTIIDWDRKEIIVPNKAFITEQLVNWSLSDPITRVIINVAVARDSDPAKVEAALYQAVKECREALDFPEPEVWFAGFGQHTQDYEVRAYAKDMSSRWPLRHTLHKLITTKLQEYQLELAYPQLEVHFNSQATRDNALIR